MQTSINYPAELPPPQWASNQWAVTSPNQRTNMDSGRARQRRKFSSVPAMRSATFIFTAGQAVTFERWFATDLKDGTEWFNIYMRHPLGFTQFVCRVVNVYNGPIAFGSKHWTYSATLEVWERPLIPEEWSLLPSFILHPDIFDAAMNREWPEA